MTRFCFGCSVGLIGIVAACGVDRKETSYSENNQPLSYRGDAGKPSEKELEARRQRIRDMYQAGWDKLNAVATTRTKLGTVIDWLPRGDQAPIPTIEMPKHALEEGEARATTELETDVEARGPEGTVPYPRFDLEGYLAAIGDDVPERPEDALHVVPSPSPDARGRYHATHGVRHTLPAHDYWTGINGRINLWNVSELVKNDTSVAQLWMTRGSGSGRQTVEAGKTEYLGSGIPRFFVYFTAVGYTEVDDWKGGYTWDLTPQDGGWHQVSTTVAPGTFWNGTLSQIDGTQIVFDISFVNDGGNWWLWVGPNEWVGYIPKCVHENCSTNPTLFSPSGLLEKAEVAEFFGEVYDTDHPDPTITDMGSGRKASEGWAKAAFFANMGVRRVGQTGFDVMQSANGAVAAYPDDANCYSILALTLSNRTYYGGGGDTEPGCN